MRLDRRQRGFLVGGSAAAVLLGTLLPWASVSAPLVGTVDLKMTDGSDWVFFIAAAVVAAIVAWKLLSDDGDERVLSIVAGLAGVVGGVLLFVEVGDIQSRFDAATAESSLIHTGLGSGIFVTGLGLAALMVAGFVGHSGKTEVQEWAKPYDAE